MKRIFLALFIFLAAQSQVKSQNSIIGNAKFVSRANLYVAEYDFPFTMTLDQAIQACSGLPGNWRLPTFEEFKQISANGNVVGLKKRGSDFYWTATNYGTNYNLLYYGYEDNMGYGEVSSSNAKFLVRAVSGANNNWNSDNKAKFNNSNIDNNLLRYISEADANDALWKKYWADIKSNNLDLFANKGEFEKTAEYEKRFAQQIELKRTSYKDYFKISENLKLEEKQKKEAAKNNQIKESIKSVLYAIKSIGNYDADNENFVINLEKKVDESVWYTGNFISKDFSNDGKTYQLKTEWKDDSLALKIKFNGEEYDFVLNRASENTFVHQVGEIKLIYFFSYKENKPYNVQLTIGNSTSNWTLNKTENYNAGGNEFNNITAKIHVPIDQAPSFKTNYTDITIEGIEMLEEDLQKKKVLNLLANFNGERYEIGKQVDLSMYNANFTENFTSVNTKIKALPKLTTKVTFEDENNNSVLDGGETSYIKITITNEGEGLAQGINLKTLVDNQASISFKQDLYVGVIEPKTEKTISIPVKSMENIVSGERNFKIEIKEANGFNPEPIDVLVSTKELIKPVLLLKEVSVESVDRLPTTLKQSETSLLTFRIQNNSAADARNVVLNVKMPQNVLILDGNINNEIPSIPAGDYYDLTLKIAPNNNANKTEEFKISYNGKYLNGSFSKVLAIEDNKSIANKVVISGREQVTTYTEVYTPDLNIDIEKDIPNNANSKTNAIAVVLGIEKYKNVGNVSFAARDASIVKEYFNKTIGIPTENIYFKLNGDVTKGELEKIFGGWLHNRVDENTSVYVYYAGHGAPAEDQNAYLIPNDGDPNYAKITGYSLNSMYEELGKLPTDKITVFIDACFSGQDREQNMLIKDARGLGIKTNGTEIPEKINVFSASGNDQVSSGWPDKKHGLFTYYMLKGLQGNADENGDKLLTYEELSNYIKGNVKRQAGFLDRKQDPESKIAIPNLQVY